MIYENIFASARKKAEAEVRKEDDCQLYSTMLLKCDREAKIHALILRKVILSKVGIILATLLMVGVSVLLLTNSYTPYEIRWSVALAGAGAMALSSYLLAETCLFLKKEKSCVNKLEVWLKRRNEQMSLLNAQGVIGHR